MSNFIVRKNALSEFWFVLKGNNNRTVLQSKMYSSKNLAENGINALKGETGGAQINDESQTNHFNEENVQFYAD